MNEFLIGKDVKLILGDSLNILPNFSSNSINCIITSPPYWGLRDYEVENQIGLECSISDYYKNLINVFSELHRILKDDGTLWLNIGDGYTSGNRKYRAKDKKNVARSISFRPDNPEGLKNKDLLGIPWHFAFILQELGWYLRCDIIWHKPNAMPESVKDRPYRNHEYLFLFSKSKKYFFQDSGLKTDGTERKLRSVWTINQTKFNGEHYATFPVELINPCILSTTKEHNTVLDPFCGTSSVGLSCLNNNRKFIGIDINRKYIEISSERLTNQFLQLNHKSY
ncbi:MAG: site-specific DNA-methyltransferase [Bacteroidales bacterium]|jgi:site-specific DNA-methyltransferase (adenine-specific)|nr:site-specific DNA-methyltransferase [Bacteroidales bacterium]